MMQVARIDVRALQAALLERRGDHAARKALAEADDQIVGARRQFADCGNAAQQIVQRIELLVEWRAAAAAKRSPSSRSARRIDMTVAQPRADRQSAALSSRPAAAAAASN